MKKTGLLLFFVLCFITGSISARVKTGADHIETLIGLLKNKKVGLVVNQTSIVGDKHTHLLDTLLSHRINVKTIFSPEHGFRGNADAGETVDNSLDEKTRLPIISLYGKNKKPTPEQLKNIDIVVYDIQDVGARFYTYTSTLFYLMQSCAEQGKSLLVLDRPNPNDYIDGPILDLSLRSFVGMMQIPVLYGLTIGELAIMMDGEKWATSQPVDVQVVPMSGWKHGDNYSLPIKPSPNLPNDLAIRLYPSLCFFEATPISIGRGTRFPFQVIGYPDKKFGHFSFTPEALPGFDKNPLQKGKKCYGKNLRQESFTGGLTLKYLIESYKQSDLQEKFFTSPIFFDRLMGNSQVRQDIILGKSEEEIRSGWQDGLIHYKKLRKKYLLYPDKSTND